jgi:DNA-directed RNA polymerase specialized sigma subunit
MPNTKKFRDLVNATVSREAQARAHAKARELLKEMPLAELRHAKDLTQTRLAELLETTQSEVSRIESRSDMYVSTLRSYIEAMGGRLEIVARFPDGAIEINQFHDAARDAA